MLAQGSGLTVGAVRESFPGEQRVAIVPAAVKTFAKSGLQTVVEAGAGQAAGYPDEQYAAQDASVEQDRAAVFAAADVLLQVRGGGGNPQFLDADLELLRPGQVLIGAYDPLSDPKSIARLAERGVSCFALEFLPRITRAQSMDILSSMATIAGYKAGLLAAAALPRMFPMMMTAAGTITPARVLVIGAGVAGLQAIATTRRLGAVVSGYDLRPAVREEVESLGAQFVELPLESGEAAESGGYAREKDEEFYRKQQELMHRVVAESDVVISTAVVPGAKAPVLITPEMVEAMAAGSVIVDLAAERGGNCALTKPGETTTHGGVTIIGETNLPSLIPYHASQMFANNVASFLQALLNEEGQLEINLEDEVIRETLVCRDGQVIHPRMRERLGLAPLESK
ncbi:NAD(P) transhydrogenase subunit alpha part 1 [Symmachiella dynata]|uniref:NAD(P) transhydrogenase subunit alpha part 1 n=1 Tax=Symmachiella dynata TaxID=2527995 RepID=A0A517ZN41_9PLAN|nr:Re/Si-specific NAD(P)(+) transhydrogenase subunit alpha [Symmachiella dynata]QDU43899.1 NAD(P) transhydrogenase subunit alpha part 1 [Symmachiella dynata]